MQFDNVVTTLLSFHHTQWSPTTSSYASLNSPRSSFDMLDLDFICTSPMWSSLSVHIVGMSIAVNNNINFTEAYQLSKVRFPIPSLHCSTKFETTQTVKSFPGVPPTPFAPESGIWYGHPSELAKTKLLYPNWTLLLHIVCLAECIPKYGIICSFIV